MLKTDAGQARTPPELAAWMKLGDHPRAFTNRAPVWIGDRLFTVSGTVCMDQFMVDLGPHSGVKVGDPVILFGPPAQRSVPPPTAAELADLAGTISYEILCGISARVPRVAV